jgi:transposase
VLSVEDWAEIRRLHRAEGLAIKLIARTLGMSRNTVRAAIASGGPPDPASRTAYPAGEIAQCDLWLPPVSIPLA